MAFRAFFVCVIQIYGCRLVFSKEKVIYLRASISRLFL